MPYGHFSKQVKAVLETEVVDEELEAVVDEELDVVAVVSVY